MPLLRYKSKKFRVEARSVIAQANDILHEYAASGYDLTLRQLYYQFVARGIIANQQSEYNKLGNIVNDARLAGLIDWDHIVDRTRNLRGRFVYHRHSPANAVSETANLYATDLWREQPERVEVWIEKDALVGVIQDVCWQQDVSYFSCRGYTSQSEMWEASQRFRKYLHNGQDVRILHLGDHDPSGIDMTRDIQDRIELFVASHVYWGDIDDSVPTGENASREVFQWAREHFKVERIALNMDQVTEYDPPPNPAKITDSRAQSYIGLYGDESWELDALPPDVLANLVTESIDACKDWEAWDESVAREEEEKDTLRAVATRWAEVKALVTS